MPNTKLTAAMREALAQADASELALETLEIDHPVTNGTLSPFYLVADLVDHSLPLTLGGGAVTFKSTSFRFSLPGSNAQGLPELSLAVDNVSQELTDFLTAVRQSTQAASVKYRPYLLSDLTQPQMDPPLVLHLTDVEVDLYEVRGRATFTDLTNRRFPGELYVRSRFPSLGE